MDEVIGARILPGSDHIPHLVFLHQVHILAVFANDIKGFPVITERQFSITPALCSPHQLPVILIQIDRNL
jgi:hypothetical protein